MDAIYPKGLARCEQTISLKVAKSKRDYPEKLRRIRFVDGEIGRSLVFIDNNFSLAAIAVFRIYKGHWQLDASDRTCVLQINY